MTPKFKKGDKVYFTERKGWGIGVVEKDVTSEFPGHNDDVYLVAFPSARIGPNSTYHDYFYGLYLIEASDSPEQLELFSA